MVHQLQRAEKWIRTILQVGVWLSSAFMVAGLLLVMLLPQAAMEPQRQTLDDLAGELTSKHIVTDLMHPDQHTAMVILYTGIVLLMLTPFFRVGAAMLGFWSENDWRYASISGLVFILLIGQLIYSLM
jgi:uncharacterized membrane protein